MFVVLSGAKKNAGDFLITERAEALLKWLRPEQEIVRLPGWESLEPHLDTINSADALIILGGPGLQKDMYPKVYKLTRSLSDIKVPLIPMGIGWKAFPGDKASQEAFKFSASSRLALEKMSKGSDYIGCRDLLSTAILRKHGIKNALMTGCPVWYDKDSLGKPMKLSSPPKRVVYTPAQLPFYREPSLRLGAVLKETFPGAELLCSFHRGIKDREKFISEAEISNNVPIMKAMEQLGFRIVDVSGSASAMSVYDEFDLHVGFRLHAHLYMLGKRLPSILLHEDGRGIGASLTLNLLGFDAFKRTPLGQLPTATPVKLRRLVETKLNGVVSSPDVAEDVRSYLHHLLETEFAAYAGVGSVIDSYFSNMKRFVASLPSTKR